MTKYTIKHHNGLAAIYSILMYNVRHLSSILSAKRNSQEGSLEISLLPEQVQDLREKGCEVNPLTSVT